MLQSLKSTFHQILAMSEIICSAFYLHQTVPLTSVLKGKEIVRGAYINLCNYFVCVFCMWLNEKVVWYTDAIHVVPPTLYSWPPTKMCEFDNK